MVNQLWTNFKTHFEDEYDKMKLVRGTTMHQAGFHQANFIASQVMEEVHKVYKTMFSNSLIDLTMTRKTMHHRHQLNKKRI